ncbi:glycoprotein-N-acetylgalactosamine 3-beta-galactosyltransferase 1-like [Mytilus californianus]|uniref:glycoprotein-N-acetylgalactosamine 3-beta-galactosyltransferase 1-like n=1 Tax=Mytilus californianus TaxID=6549 RepID=UPI002246E98E|nr:glycoprotein-N-acetylgalactosamine 3-beta-galactosyltransferase 1-like [Mytilus californianus]
MQFQKYGSQKCHYSTSNTIIHVLNLKVIGLISLVCIVFCAISYTMMYTTTISRRLGGGVLVRKSKDFTTNNSWIFTESNKTHNIKSHRNSVDIISTTLKPEKADGIHGVDIRILCWIMTCPNNLHIFAIHVKNTWGKRCDILLFMSSKPDKDFPAIGLRTQEGHNHLTDKSMQAWRHVFEHYRDKADWFFKADDDTYVIVENLKYLLKDYNTSEPIFFGQHFVKPDTKQSFNTGGPGYVLSKEALIKLGTRGNNIEECKQDGEFEDVDVSKCLLKFGVKIGNTLDEQHRTRFHHLTIDKYLFGTYPSWYYEYNTKTLSKGPDSMSDYVISFHYVKPELMHIIDFFIYHLKLYNIHSS